MKMEMSEQEIDIQNKKIDQLDRLIHLTKMNLLVNIIQAQVYFKVALRGEYIDKETYDNMNFMIDEFMEDLNSV